MAIDDRLTSTTVPAAGANRLLHTMLRVTDLERALRFYTGSLDMRLLRRDDYPGGRFTLAFVGYGDEDRQTVLELTHNWDDTSYELGNAYGHIAISVADLDATCARLVGAGVRQVRAPGPMSHRPARGGEVERIAFFEDPDGYRVELIEQTPAKSSNLF